MSDNDDDRTMYVAPPLASTGAIPLKPVPAADVDGPPDADRTVTMKPSQRARAAAEALSEERRERALRNTTAPRPVTSRVDFDVMSGGTDVTAPATAPATRKVPLVALVTAALVALGVAGYFML